SHTARAPAVDDAADYDFAWVVARGSSTTGGCIGRRGLATSGKTPGEAFLAGARLLQGAAPQALSCGEALQALLEVGGARLRGPPGRRRLPQIRVNLREQTRPRVTRRHRQVHAPHTHTHLGADLQQPRANGRRLRLSSSVPFN